jgi:cytochrome c1
MPASYGTLSDQQLSALVAYIESLSEEAAAEEATAEEATAEEATD